MHPPLCVDDRVLVRVVGRPGLDQSANQRRLPRPRRPGNHHCPPPDRHHAGVDEDLRSGEPRHAQLQLALEHVQSPRVPEPRRHRLPIQVHGQPTPIPVGGVRHLVGQLEHHPRLPPRHLPAGGTPQAHLGQEPPVIHPRLERHPEGHTPQDSGSPLSGAHLDGPEHTPPTRPGGISTARAGSVRLAARPEAPMPDHSHQHEHEHTHEHTHPDGTTHSHPHRHRHTHEHPHAPGREEDHGHGSAGHEHGPGKDHGHPH